jgi:hypothetical protein
MEWGNSVQNAHHFLHSHILLLIIPLNDRKNLLGFTAKCYISPIAQGQSRDLISTSWKVQAVRGLEEGWVAQWKRIRIGTDRIGMLRHRNSEWNGREVKRKPGGEED